MGAWIKGGLGVLSSGGDKVRQLFVVEPLVIRKKDEGSDDLIRDGGVYARCL